MTARELLDLIADYVDARRNLEVGDGLEIVGEDALDALADRAEALLSSYSPRD